MAENIHQFQAGRRAAMAGLKRDGRKSRDWLEGFDLARRDILGAYGEGN